MAGMIYEFIEGLGEENKQYIELIRLGNEKRSQIIKGNLELINKVNKDEESVVIGLKALERKRREAMDDIAMILNLDPKTITISQIEKAMENQPEEAKMLGETRLALKKSLAELKIINDENILLINEALDYANFSMNVMQSSMGSQPMNANYGDGAEPRNDSFFDAKQ